jgi:hypothetical protein
MAGAEVTGTGRPVGGEADALELEGIFLDAADGVMRLAVVKRASSSSRFPTGSSYPNTSPAT